MLISTVVLPEAFAQAHFADPSYHLNAEVFLRAIHSNGLILVDRASRLYVQLCDAIEPLAAHGKGKRTHALFEELLKQRLAGVNRLVVTNCRTPVSLPARDVAIAVARNCRPTALIVDPANAAGIPATTLAQTEVVPIPEYISSAIENERRRWVESMSPVDLMAAGEFDQHIARCTRFSKLLRFYDKQIGNASGLSRFRRGIETIIRGWVRNAHFPRTDLAVEVYCTVQRTVDPTEVVRNRIAADLIQKLAQSFGVRVSLHFKQDSNSITHDRYLQMETVALSFSKGFDFVNDDGSYQRCSVRIDNGVFGHLEEYRRLPDYCPPT